MDFREFLREKLIEICSQENMTQDNILEALNREGMDLDWYEDPLHTVLSQLVNEGKIHTHVEYVTLDT